MKIIKEKLIREENKRTLSDLQTSIKQVDNIFSALKDEILVTSGILNELGYKEQSDMIFYNLSEFEDMLYEDILYNVYEIIDNN